MVFGNRFGLLWLSSFLLSFVLATSVSAQQPADSSETRLTVTDPTQLIENEKVPVTETNRTLRKAKFEGLQKRYRSIEGIVMVGVVNGEGEVLLKGPGNWTPPGGAVQPGEDWAAAARRAIRQQAGMTVQIEQAELVERMLFHQEGNSEKQFSAYILHFRAAPEGSYSKSDMDNAKQFGWFSAMPEHTHPNHIEHIKLYLD